jgi:hypothetical protein
MFAAASNLPKVRALIQRRDATGYAVGVRKFVDTLALNIDGADQFDSLDLAERHLGYEAHLLFSEKVAA